MKSIFSALVLASGMHAALAYVPAGPVANGGDSWQTANMGYGGLYAPKNIGEEYRRTMPVLFYAYDANFIDYFSLQGATAVDGAFSVLNALTNVDSYSKTLTEFPLQSRSVNYQAQALGLVDLKSHTLGLMMLQLGLGDPIRYSWTLRSRVGICSPPAWIYTVVQRNLDFVPSAPNQVQYSPYVNDILYSYTIQEGCPIIDAATTVPFSVDPLAAAYAPLASSSPSWGEYFTQLSRDDMAGLRYLLTTNNMNWETPAAETQGLFTNNTVMEVFPPALTGGSNSVLPIQIINGQPYGTSSYADLLLFSRTNNPAALQAAYPGLEFTLLSSDYQLVTVTNVVAYYTNATGSTISNQVLKIVNVPTQTVVQYFNYRFDNIVTNLYSTTTTATNQTITVGPVLGSTIGSPSITNTSSRKTTLNVPSGEFYILPVTNGVCAVDIVRTLVTFTNYTTNVISVATPTNTVNTTNTLFYAQLQIIPFVGHIYLTRQVTCSPTNAPAGLYRGIGKVSFVRADFDSLLGQFWQPVTNDYSMVSVTNGKSLTRVFRRVVTQPDFLLTAADNGGVRTTVNVDFNTADVRNGLAGPGSINPVTTITYDKVGPLYMNRYNDFMDGAPYFNVTPGNDITDLFYNAYYVWSSFDGSTNTPVVFPNGTSIEDLQNQMLTRFGPDSLPMGITADEYFPDPGPPVELTVTGGAYTAPFTWTVNDLVLDSIGLQLSPEGRLTGTPTQSGTFDFAVTMTDAAGRSAQWMYSIIIQSAQ